jgi:hypothetical protein
MSSTLYLLRQQPNSISSSLFRASDADVDVILLKNATSMISFSVEGTGNGLEAGNSDSAFTYDDLVEKIFSSEHVIVL